jgi:plasmid stabilization system protein ParE
MVRKIVWREGARADLVAIKDYIARESSLARAEKVVAAIEQAADGLADFPYRFRKIPEFNDPDRRETFVYKYRVMYRVEPRCIRILRVVHGRRLLKNVPGSFEESPQVEYVAG